MDTGEPMATATDTLTLAQWFGANFPIGSYAYSHGLETMISEDVVTDAASFAQWLRDVMERGTGRQDAILLSLAYRGDAAEVADLALALSAGRERQFEAVTLGAAFAKVVGDVWSEPLENWPYPVVVGAAGAKHGIALPDLILYYLQSLASNYCTIAARAIPIGQSEAQRVLKEAAPMIERIAFEAQNASESDLGSATLAADVASIAHETNTVRIFRT